MKFICLPFYFLLCLLPYVTEASHLHSLRDFWRHFGLCRAAAHSDCCFPAPCTNILTYLLTLLYWDQSWSQSLVSQPTSDLVISDHCPPGYLIICTASQQFAMSCTGCKSTTGLSINSVWCLQTPTSPCSIIPVCVPLSSVTTCRHMRAATQGDLNFPRMKTVTFVSCAFAVSGWLIE